MSSANGDVFVRTALETGWTPIHLMPPATVPDLTEAIETLFARFHQDLSANTLGVPRRTLRRWLEEERGGKRAGAKKLARQAEFRREAGKLIDSRESAPNLRARARRLATARTWNRALLTVEIVFSQKNGKKTTDRRTIEFVNKSVASSTHAAGKTLDDSDGNPFDKIVDMYEAGEFGLMSPLFDAMDPWYQSMLESDDPYECAVIIAASFS